MITNFIMLYLNGLVVMFSIMCAVGHYRKIMEERSFGNFVDDKKIRISIVGMLFWGGLSLTSISLLFS